MQNSTVEFARIRRQAFTLVELLVVISIIALLASMILVALAGVQETSRVDRTRAQIARIDTLVMEKWENYKSRRFAVPQSPTPQLAAFWSVAPPTLMMQWRTNPATWIARYQVDAIRELMRMELPERKTDLLTGSTVPNTMPSALWTAYRNKARKLLIQKKHVTLPYVNDPAFSAELDRYWTSEFESAECLYLILSQLNNRDRASLEFFAEKEIGDIDGDGLPEIHDSWGRPIVFARWAPGLQIAGSPQDGKAPDPFDLRGVYPTLHQVNTFALYPLISSSGPDQRQEIFLDNPTEAARVDYTQTHPRNNPYLAASNVYMEQVQLMIGSPQDSNDDGINGSLDNITNHNLTGS